MEVKEKYQAFCESENYLPIFHQAWYLDAVCPGSKWDATIAERDGKVVGVFPYYLKFKKPYNYITQPPNSRMMGPYVSGPYREKEVYRSIVKEMTKALPKVEFFYQCFHYAVSDWLSFYSSKYNGKKLYSYILNDFSDLSKSYSNLHRPIRDKHIPEARKKLEIKKGLDSSTFYNILKQEKEEKNKKLEFSQKEFEKYHAAIIKNKSGDIFYAQDKEGNIHGAGLLMWDLLSSYFYLTAENVAFAYTHSIDFLTWSCIEFTSKELKLDFFDFGGNNVDTTERIPHPFGAVLVPFLSISRYDSKKFEPFKTMSKRANRRNA